MGTASQTPRDGPPTLYQYLLEFGQLEPYDLEGAKRLAHERGQTLGSALTRLGLVSDEALTSAFCEVLGAPRLADDEVPVDPLEASWCQAPFLREARLVPLSVADDGIRVASADPENEFAVRALEFAADKPVSLVIATHAQIDRAHEAWFGDRSADEPATSDEPVAEADTDSIEKLRDLASEAPIVRRVERLVRRAYAARASDIHIEPTKEGLKVRFRIDGLLQTVERLPARETAAVVSRIKLISRMNIAERRLPQDGRVQLRVQGATVDLRVSSVPTVDGESLVLRLLDQDKTQLALEELGFSPRARAAIEHCTQAANGIVLVTGPTGSGKTTTLYAMLRRINAPERMLVTIEDPVEYQLAGINQIQVKPQIGLDFAAVLRSVVRQDPDVIMIGEMRDVETARIAVQSALTGHLVFSTLHTNDAGGSITRLLDMGVEDYLVTSSVNAVIAQRLVRRLCDQCKVPFAPSDALVERFNLNAHASERPLELYEPVGCPACDDTGFHGRLVIGEVLVLSDATRRAVLDRADGKALEALAVTEGMETMLVDGVRKSLEGLTTLDEVTRVT